MADTTATKEVEQFSNDVHKEWTRNERFAPFSGKKTSAVFQNKTELSNMPGITIHIPLVTRLKNAGIQDDNTLRGNEEALGNFNHPINVNQFRNAVRIGQFEQQKSQIKFLQEARPQLVSWGMEHIRDRKIRAMLSPVIDGVTTYASATEAQKDAWLDAQHSSLTNSRVLFGAALGNISTSAPAGGATNDHSASLLNVDSTTDIFQPTIVSLMKRMAQTADRHIRPIQLTNPNREIFVAFTPSRAFRDLAVHSTMTAANRDARVRGLDHPIFKGGDLWYDGVLIVEIPEIAALVGVGNSGINVDPVFLCGAQSVGVGWARKTHAIREDQDYENLEGHGIAFTYGVEKLMFDSIQNGQVTGYMSGVADA